MRPARRPGVLGARLARHHGDSGRGRRVRRAATARGAPARPEPAPQARPGRGEALRRACGAPPRLRARDPRHGRQRYAGRRRERREARAAAGLDGDAGRAAGEVHARRTNRRRCGFRSARRRTRQPGEFHVQGARRRRAADASTAGIRSSSTRTSGGSTSTTTAATTLKVIDVKTAPNLTVGYIMGVGDEVPAAIEQLGAKVEMIGPDDLAWGDLSRFDTIVHRRARLRAPRRSAREQQPAARLRARTAAR